ncbi:hypothetical protein, partial [Sphingobacterium prati]|uniref:hypothetical protein n=1 Tax=Sphingobacterium prati TaxID=2737006 RepID=UPI003B43B542
SSRKRLSDAMRWAEQMGVDIAIGSGQLKSCTGNPAQQIDGRLKAFSPTTDIKRKNKQKETTDRASKSNILVLNGRSPDYLFN